MLINHDCKTSFGLIWDDLFTNWKIAFDSDPRLYDLKLLVLDSSSLWRTDTIVISKFKKKTHPSQVSPPSLLSPPQMGLK